VNEKLKALLVKLESACGIELDDSLAGYVAGVEAGDEAEAASWIEQNLFDADRVELLMLRYLALRTTK
jgi:hypothetical protein